MSLLLHSWCLLPALAVRISLMPSEQPDCWVQTTQPFPARTIQHWLCLEKCLLSCSATVLTVIQYHKKVKGYQIINKENKLFVCCYTEFVIFLKKSLRKCYKKKNKLVFFCKSNCLFFLSMTLEITDVI